jgi:hypothetical protein
MMGVRDAFSIGSNRVPELSARIKQAGSFPAASSDALRAIFAETVKRAILRYS